VRPQVEEFEARQLPSNWISLGQPLGSNHSFQSISTIRDSRGLVHVFGLDWVGNIWECEHTNQNSTIWSGPGFIEFPQATPITAITAANDANGNLDLFALGNDHAVYEWNEFGWTKIGGYVATIAVGHEFDGRLDIFAVGMNHALYQARQTSPGGSWLLWNNLGNYNIQSIKLGNEADGRIDVFALQTNHTVEFLDQIGFGGVRYGSWGSWQVAEPSGNIIAIDVATGRDGRVDLFVLDSYGNLYGHQEPTPSGYNFSYNYTNWFSLPWLGGAGFGSFVAGNAASGAVQVAAIDTTGRMWSSHELSPSYPTSGFSNWYYLGWNIAPGYTGPVPRALQLSFVNEANNSLDLFALDQNNAVDYRML
jgi:hypothetical protein